MIRSWKIQEKLEPRIPYLAKLLFKLEEKRYLGHSITEDILPPSFKKCQWKMHSNKIKINPQRK